MWLKDCLSLSSSRRRSRDCKDACRQDVLREGRVTDPMLSFVIGQDRFECGSSYSVISSHTQIESKMMFESFDSSDRQAGKQDIE